MRPTLSIRGVGGLALPFIEEHTLIFCGVQRRVVKLVRGWYRASMWLHMAF